MKELIIFMAFTGVLFIGFLAILIFGIAKMSRIIILVSGMVFIFFVTLGSITIFRLLNKSYHKATSTLRPRTGEEIYSALFGKPHQNCLKIINKQDQVVPKIDYAIWLEFQTCPEELKRILSQKEFTKEKISTRGLSADQSSTNNTWFRPETLGDSIWIYKYSKDNYGNGQTIYISRDSTKAFCIDIAD